MKRLRAKLVAAIYCAAIHMVLPAAAQSPADGASASDGGDSATGQSAEAPLYRFLSRQGFILADTHSLMTEGLALAGELRQNEDGVQYGAYQSDSGFRFVTRTDYCTSGPCLGFIFAAFFPATTYRATTAQLNAFNTRRPHGNASYNPNLGAYVLQRMVTNVSGVTFGSFAGEVGVFDAYLSDFVRFLDAPSTGFIAGAQTTSTGFGDQTDVFSQGTAVDPFSLVEDIAEDLGAEKIFNTLGPSAGDR